MPSASTSLTYSNIYKLSGEANRIYDFYRGLDGSFKPSYAYSDDSGQTWTSGNVIIQVPSTGTLQRPYVRYVSNGTDTVHFIYGEGHPRDLDTSLYHLYYKGGALYRSDGTRIAALSEGLSVPTLGTRIFQADSQHVAWASDLVLDSQSRPVVTYSVQMNSAGLPTGQGATTSATATRAGTGRPGGTPPSPTQARASTRARTTTAAWRPWIQVTCRSSTSPPTRTRRPARRS